MSASVSGLRDILFAIALTCALPNVIRGQIDTGSIIGTVQDPSGSALANAGLTATNEASGSILTTKANDAGQYQFSDLRPGDYTVKASAPGFSAQLVRDVHIDVQTRARVDFSLKVGQVTEVLEIQAVTPLLQTQDADVGGVVLENQIRDLPLNGRRYADLALLEAG